MSLLTNVFAQKVSTVDDSPKRLYYLIDVSPSMSYKYGTSSKTRIEVVKEKLIDHVEAAPNRSTIILYTFSGKDSVVRKGTFELSSDDARKSCAQYVQKEINYVRRSETYLYSAVAKVQKDAEADLKNSAPNTVAALTVFSDGEASPQDKTKAPKDLDDTLKRLYEVYIHIGSKVQPQTQETLEQDYGFDGVFTAAEPRDLELPIIPVLNVRPSATEIEVGKTISFVSGSVGEIAKTEIRIPGELTPQIVENHIYDYVFKTPGTKKIELVEYSLSGKKYSTSASVNVVPKTPLKSKFVTRSQDSSKIVVGERIYFENKSTGDYETCSWRFSNGTVQKVDAAKNSYQSFSVPGEYVVTLTITDAEGNSDSSEQKIVVSKLPAPVADFSAPSCVVAGAQFTLVDRSQGKVKSRSWKVDDEFIGDEQEQAYTFPKNYVGSAKITLVVSGESGASEPLTKEITVEPYPKPQPGFSVPSRVQVGELFQIADASIDSDETIFRICEQQIDPTRYSSDANDPNVVGWIIEELPQGVEEQEIVVEQICKNDGGEASLTKKIVVQPYPVAKPNFVLNPESVEVGDTFEIVDLAQDSVKTIFQVDGEQIDPSQFLESDSSDESPAPEEQKEAPKSLKIRFDEPGVKTITQVCVNKSGVESVLSKTLEVRPYPPAKIELLGDKPEAYVGRETTFPFSVADAVKLTLDYGDGAEIVEFDELPQTVKATHVYQKKGEYVVKASALGRDGQETALEIKVDVVPKFRPPEPNFETQINVVEEGKKVEVCCKNASSTAGASSYVYKYQTFVDDRPYGEVGVLKDKSDWSVPFDAPCLAVITLTISCDDGEYNDVQTSRNVEITPSDFHKDKHWLLKRRIALAFLIITTFAAVVGIALWLLYRWQTALRGSIHYRKQGEFDWKSRSIDQYFNRTFQFTPDPAKKTTTISIEILREKKKTRYQVVLNAPKDVKSFEKSKRPTLESPLAIGDYEIAFYSRR